MTENVQRTMDRLTGSARRASESFTRTQDKLNAGARNMGRTAERVREQLGQTGGALNRLFGRFRFQAKELFGGMKQGWRDALDERGLKGFGDVFRRMNPLRSIRTGFGNLFGGMREGVQDALGDGVKKAGKRGTNTIRKQWADAIYKGLEMGGGRGIPPLLGSIARVTGPLAIATMGYMVAAKAYGAAKAFDPSARELRLANLGKTPAEQTALRDQVLGMAGNNGFNAQEATSAFIAVQRTSGASTTAVNSFVSEVGKAAGALNMDFMPMVAGSAKVLKDFGLPLERATDLLDSNVKAMAAGKVTYDMLAKAQADFASGARLANQRLDTANSLYAAFAANGNDASKAGDRLTSTMESLRHTNTIKAFKDIGVNVLDAQGQLRQMDEVARELVPRLAGLNDAQFNALKQQFKGNDGLVELLDLARGSSEQLLGTLDKFKNSKLGINAQLEATKNDLDITAKQIEERMNTAWINIGNGMRPMFQKLQKGLLWVVEGISDSMAPHNAAQERRDVAMKGPGNGGREAMNSLIVERYNEQIKLAKQIKEGWSQENIKSQRERIAQLTSAIDDVMGNWRGRAHPNDIGKAAGDGTTELLKDEPANDPLKTGAAAIVGGGKQVRNVNVTIQKLVEKLEVRTMGTVREGISSVRQQVEQALVDIVRGGEAALANG